MKAVILAAGEGKRLRPITYTRPKPLIPIAGKPLLEYTILGLRNSGITDILLIVGYKEDDIKSYFGDGKEKFNLNIQYLTQDKYLGTAHAAGLARDFVRNDNFLLMYGDILIDINLFKIIIKKFEEIKAQGLISLIKVPNPQDYGIISLNSEGFVQKIEEKPPVDSDSGDLANAGIFIFTPLIFEAISKTGKSIRGEYEFTDSMEILFNELNGNILGYDIESLFWSDIGLPWQLLDANKFLLDQIPNEILGNVEENVTISGNVYIGSNTIVKSGTTIQGPCFIGENTRLGPNAFLRPYCSIGDDCHIGISETKNSIIFSGTKVPHFNYIGDSILCEHINLGAGTKISNLRFDNKNVKMNINGKSIDSGRRKLGAIIGANSQTGINTSIMCGKLIGENCIIGAHTLVNEDIPSNTLYYSTQKGTKKDNFFNK
jgi:bifunctional UDP-N-acetylglucosamine pyrophosphorylase/glucosamine-1-phosphate N-acetyltransferase